VSSHELQGVREMTTEWVGLEFLGQFISSFGWFVSSIASSDTSAPAFHSCGLHPRSLIDSHDKRSQTFTALY